MTEKGHMMSLAVVKVTAFVVSDAVAVWAAVTDATWLAAGTFVVTVGGVFRMLYQMRIDSQKDQSIINLKAATARIDLLEGKAEVADKHRQLALDKAHAAEVKAELAEKAMIVAKADADNIRSEMDRLRQSQHEIRNNQGVIRFAQEEMRADLARKTVTPDPDHPMPVTIVVGKPVTEEPTHGG